MKLSEVSKESIEILEQWAAKKDDDRSFSIEKPLYQKDIRIWVYDANLRVGVSNIDALAVKSVEELEDLLSKKARKELENNIKHLQQFAKENE